MRAMIPYTTPSIPPMPLPTLSTCYAANCRPDALLKEQLVEMTGLSSRVIRVWFQNKRCKDNKRVIRLKQMQHEKVWEHQWSRKCKRSIPFELNLERKEVYLQKKGFRYLFLMWHYVCYLSFQGHCLSLK